MVANCSGERSFSRFKRIKNELKGHNVPWEVVRTKHSIRGVTRLDGAQGKKLDCAPIFEPEVFRIQCTVLKNVHCDNVGTFIPLAQWCGAPVVIPRVGNCATLPPRRYAPAFDTLKVKNLGKQIVMISYIILLWRRQDKTLSLFTVLCSALLDSMIAAFYFFMRISIMTA